MFVYFERYLGFQVPKVTASPHRPESDVKIKVLELFHDGVELICLHEIKHSEDVNVMLSIGCDVAAFCVLSVDNLKFPNKRLLIQIDKPDLVVDAEHCDPMVLYKVNP